MPDSQQEICVELVVIATESGILFSQYHGFA